MKLFKNIQDNIRLKSPNLWNLYLIPIVGCTLLLHILLFCVTYAVAQIQQFKIGYIDEIYTMSLLRTTEGQIIITCSFILAIILAVWWFINLSRNNPIKSFYPLSKTKYYLNFIGVTFILSLLCFSPIIVEYARYFKINSISTIIDNKKDQETIIKFDLLSNFLHPYSQDRYINNNIEKLDDIPEHFKNLTSPSYMFFDPNHEVYLKSNARIYSKMTENEIRELQTKVRREIINRNRNYILTIYNDFNDYYKRITNSKDNIILKPERLSEEIVNDPYLLLRHISEVEITGSRNKRESPNMSYSNEQGRELSNLANYINRLTYEKEMHHNTGVYYFALNVALFFSILITLYRQTNSATILFASLYLILLTIVNSIVKALIPEELSLILIMLCGTIVIPSILVRKAFKQNSKSKLSDIIMVILIVGILFLPLMLDVIFAFYLDEIYIYIYMLLVMLPIHHFMLDWKSLANR